MSRFSSFASLVLLLASTGCGLFSGVRVKTAQTIVKPPANVSLYVSVEDQGEPIDYLDDGSFQIYENDVLLNSADVGLRLLPRDGISVGHTVLLLDLGGTRDAAALEQLAKGAAHFVEKVSVTQDVTVLGFDGAAGARRIATFARVSEPTPREMPALAAFASGDSSRDLRGAVLGALGVLDTELKKSPKPVKLGTLVVLSQGPDLAGRKTDRELYQALEASPAEHYLISPDQVEITEAGPLGEDGRYTFTGAAELPMRLQDLGMRVRKAWGRHYLLTYCSPSRAGKRDVTISVHFNDSEGAGRSGSGDAEFVADGFTAGCHPPLVTASSRLMDGEEPQAPSTEAEATPAPVAPAPAPTVTKKKAASPAKAPKTEPPKASPPKTESKPATEEVVAPPSSGKYK
jgi:hypothetical protein